MDEPRTEKESATILAQLKELVAEAKSGNPEGLPQIRQILKTYPALARHYGDLSGHVESKWITRLAGDNACVKESIVIRVDELRSELLGNDPSPLERLLVERIVTSWLMVRYFDTALVIATQGIPATQARFMDEQLQRAQRRHTGAIKALAEVRKLLPAA